MKPVGGYFELEFPTINNLSFHHDGILVNSGRNALEYILLSIGIDKIDRIYLPYYTCEVVLQPLGKYALKYEFYQIDSQLQLINEIELGENDYIIVNNYFGIQDNYVKELTKKYYGKIIVDNSQALYSPVLSGQYAFYSPRKFVGLPDGGIAYAKEGFEIQDKERDQDSLDRSSHLIKRLYGGPSAGYEDFRENSKKLNNIPLKRMSNLTKLIFDSFDYEEISKKRKANYDYLRDNLQPTNLLSTPSSDEISCPMVYPYLTTDNELKQFLINNQIFVATYWPNISNWCTNGQIECQLMRNLLSLPIDQRYKNIDMQRIAEIIAR